MAVTTVQEAYERGIARSIACRKRAAAHLWNWAPLPETQQAIDGESAAAEWLAAKHYGLAWLSSEDTGPTKGALEGGVRVRWTDREDGSMIVHACEVDERVLVLVTGNMPFGIVRGWILAGAAKQDEWWRSNVRFPAYFVPQSALRQDDLQAWLRERGRI